MLGDVGSRGEEGCFGFDFGVRHVCARNAWKAKVGTRWRVEEEVEA